MLDIAELAKLIHSSRIERATFTSQLRLEATQEAQLKLVFELSNP
jgi:hypothetical protein